MAEEQEGKISYADYSVIDEYLKLKRDSDEIFQQHKEQLVEKQKQIDNLKEQLAKKDAIIEQLQQQLLTMKKQGSESGSEKDRIIQEQAMQIQTLNARLAGFQRRG